MTSTVAPPKPRAVAFPIVVITALVLASLLVSVPFASASSFPVPTSLAPAVNTLSSNAPAPSSIAPSPAPQSIAGPWWFNVSGANHGPGPGLLDSASAAYDPVDQVTVLFGGCTSSMCPSNETWLFSRGRWANVTDPTDAPPARYGASLDFDTNMHGLLLFGGSGTGGELADTWLYSGGHWTNLTWVSSGPAPRRYAGMVFDPQPEENGSVLFGGQLASGLTTNDTWVWRSWAGWEALNTSLAPAPVDRAGFAFSPRDGYALLYGGVEVCGLFCFGVVNQTWELYAGEWWPVQTVGPSPGGRAGAAMDYAPSLGEIVLFSGLNTSFSNPADTWAYHLGTWRNITSGASPPARFDPAFAVGSNLTAPILVGGVGPSEDFNDTWVLEYSLTTGISVSSPLETSLPATIALQVGGSQPLSAVVDFGDGTSGAVSGLSSALRLTHVYTTPGPITLFANATDAVGVVWLLFSATLTVAAGPAVSIATPVSQADVGAAVHLRANVVSAGAAPLSVSWSFGDGATGSGLNVTHAYSAAGTYTVHLNATDGAGASVTDSAPVVIAAVPSVAAEASPVSTNAGVAVVFFANVTGGTAPYTYAWSFGDGNTSGSPNPVHPYRSAGTFTAVVWVNDSGGGTATKTVTVTIASPTVQQEGTPLWYWGALAALIAVGALGAALLVLSLRRKSRT